MIEFETILILAFSYLIGTFPSGILLAILHGVNITTQGSGSPGATNVSRVVGKIAGITTLLLDIFKGILAVSVVSLASDSDALVILAGLFVVLGHCYSIPGLLKGGKGVATSLGVLIAVSPSLGVIAAAVFFICFLATRIVSLSSIVASLALALYLLIIKIPNNPEYFSLLAVCLIVVIRHHENIKRLLSGNEKKFSFAKK